MPADIRRLFSAVATEDLARPGTAGLFSPVEQVWHLADLEAEGFCYRIEALRDRVDPVLPDFDGAATAIARNYRSRSLEEGLARFEMNGQDA